jgi:hypothetical protein
MRELAEAVVEGGGWVNWSGLATLVGDLDLRLLIGWSVNVPVGAAEPSQRRSSPI